MHRHREQRDCGPRGFAWAMMRHGPGRGRGFGPFGGGGYGGEGGGGRRRVFDSGELRLVLLRLIADQPRHGYDLIRAIEARTGGAYAPSPGVVYPTLTLLGDMDLIAETTSDGARKQFTVTDAGTAELAAKSDEVAALLARLDEMGAMRAKTDGAPIRRAMGNLRAVLGNRLTADDVTAETLHQVAAILDEASQRIERL